MGLLDFTATSSNSELINRLAIAVRENYYYVAEFIIQKLLERNVANAILADELNKLEDILLNTHRARYPEAYELLHHAILKLSYSQDDRLDKNQSVASSGWQGDATYQPSAEDDNFISKLEQGVFGDFNEALQCYFSFICRLKQLIKGLSLPKTATIPLTWFYNGTVHERLIEGPNKCPINLKKLKETNDIENLNDLLFQAFLEKNDALFLDVFKILSTQKSIGHILDKLHTAPLSFILLRKHTAYPVDKACRSLIEFILKERRYHLIYRLITRYEDSVKYFQDYIIRTNQTDNYFYCLICINPGLAGSYLSAQQYIFELVYLELEKYSGIASGTVDLNIYFARLLTDFYDAYLKQFITQGINQKNYELARFIRKHFAKSRLFPELADSLSLADAVDNKRLNVSDCFFNTKWMKTLTEARENYISSAESIIRIHPYGFLAATKNSEELKPELFYSGLKMQFNEKAITVSMGGVTYRPVAFGRDSGLWLHIPSSMKNDSHQSPKYGHIVTTGCLMGCTVWGIFKMGDQEIRLSLTQPNIEIPSGACLVKIFVEYESHVYEEYLKMHLRQSIPYLKDMMVDKKKGIIFFGLGLANYINYGIRYYLQGIFSKEQFIQYIGEVRSHGNAYKDEIEKLSEAFDVDIRPISTLDGLKFYSYTPEEMIEYFHNNKITNESTLTDMFIKELRKLPGLIGRYYKNLTKSQKEELDNSSKKLLTLNYIDYVGVVEYARTLSMGLLDKNALSFYPFEEGHIIKRHAKLYTPTCSITWLPFFIPQSTILSKLFYQTYDIQLFNALIQNGAIALLSKMVYAIASQHPVLYLKTKDEIEKLVVSVGCSVDELNDSLVVSNKISH